jgi:DNA-binding NtrC family response regulator
MPGGAAKGEPGKKAPRARVVVADDEESMRWFVGRGLDRLGFDVETFDGGAALLERCSQRRVDVAVVDLKMPELDGLEVLTRLHAQAPEVIVILMTAYGTIATAVAAMRQGAWDFVTKPFEIDELALLIERALDHRGARSDSRELHRLLDPRSAQGMLIGQSPAMQEVQATIETLRESSATVLILGESGTGKELVARSLHVHSPRARGPFVAVHCAAVPETLFESELFGYEPGAFTGAVRRRRGMIAEADGGTLFLDEIGEIGLAGQAKLERFLSERECTPLGATRPVPVDTRVIAATNRDLDEAVRQGRMRRELLFRLDVVPIRLAPLRDRPEDVAPLAAYYLQRYASEAKVPVPVLTAAALEALARHPWPGNVRELQNAMQRLIVMNPGRAQIDVDALPVEIRTREERPIRSSSLGDTSWADAATDFERRYLAEIMRRTRGNVSEAARLAGVSRSHLHRRLKDLALDPDQFRNG